MRLARFIAASRRPSDPPFSVAPPADERPRRDSAGGVIAAWTVFLVLFVLLLAATVLDATVRVGGVSLDPASAWLDRGGDPRRDELRPR
jgi:hypothetical protein